MASTVEICNMALHDIGQTIGIASLNEASKAARVCALHFQPVLDEVIAAHPWPFAAKAAALALVADAPLPGWAYQYAYPADCVRAGRVCTEDGVRVQMQVWQSCSWDPCRGTPLAPFVPYQVMSGEKQSGIVTDLEAAWLIYTQRQLNPSRLPPLVIAAMHWALAARIAMPITSDPRIQQNAVTMANIAFVTATAQGFGESSPDEDPTPPSIAARG